MSLKKKAVVGLAWTFTQEFGTQIITFIVSVVLARILSPEEFGLIGMLSIFINVGKTLMDSGLTSSLIRTSDASQEDYSTVFFINIVGSVLLYAILFLSAPAISSFYKQEVLTNIIRIYTLTFVIQAFVSIQATRLTKEMNFKTQLTIQLPSLIGGGVLGIILAKLGYGVWSLVWMNLFQTLLSTIQHWLYSKWRPNFKFDKKRFKYHFDFGYKMTIANLIETFYANIYTVVIGKYFSAAQVGYYTRSVGLRQLPITNVFTALNKVSYPMFSSIQDDNVKLKISYRKVTKQLFYWITPLLLLLTVSAEPFIRFLLGEKWLPAVPYFQIICISGIVYPLKFNLNILKVKGRSDLRMKLEMVKKIYSIVVIIFAIRFGIIALLYCQMALDALEFFINSYFTGRLINYSVKELLRDITPIIFLAVLMGSLTWLLDSWLINKYVIPDISRLLINGTFFFGTYITLSFLMRFSSIQDFKELIFAK